MKKIILVSNTSWSMIKFRYGLMKMLIQKEYDVYVVAPYDEYSTQIQDMGCTYIDVKMDNKGHNPFNDLKLTMDLFAIYKKIKPDLIFHYTIKPNIYGAFATFLSDRTSISIISGLGYTFLNHNLTAKVAKWLYKIALKIPSQVWFINYDDANVFQTYKLVKPSKIRILEGEGVNTETFKPLDKQQDQDKAVFLMVARVLKDKGVYEFIEAIRIIKQQYDNVEFQLAGPIYTLNPSAIREEEVYDWVKEGLITYFGEVKDVRNYIANADCVVLPSYREGLSMSLMEAASMAKPLIASNVPGCKEIIDNEISGFLCEPRNANSLAESIEKILLLNTKEREKMGKAGRNKMLQQFDEKIILNTYLKEIEKRL